MTERELQALVVEAAGWFGYWSYHTHDSRRSQPGFPDLVLVHRETGRTIYVELKSATGRLSDAQREALTLLAKRNETYLWKPADWTSGRIRGLLMAEPGARVDAAVTAR